MKFDVNFIDFNITGGVGGNIVCPGGGAYVWFCNWVVAVWYWFVLGEIFIGGEDIGV